VGGVGGAIVGGTLGGLSDPDREYVYAYVRRNRLEPERVQGDVAVGVTLPGAIHLHAIEGRPAAAAYSYAYLNGHPVLIETRSRKVVQIIE
jgi:hypothetical protein